MSFSTNLHCQQQPPMSKTFQTSIGCSESFSFCLFSNMCVLPFAFSPLILSLSLALLTFSPTRAASLPSFNLELPFSQAENHIQLPSVYPALRIPPNAQELPCFREAPAFCNGKECSSLPDSLVDESQKLCDPLSVHVAMTLDIMYMRGSFAAVLSIVQHAACPENVVFHFLATERHEELGERVRSTFPYLKFKVYQFDESLVRDRISFSIREALDQPLNYARTYIPDILPECIHRIIYLDSDLLVVDDIAKLWSTDLESYALGAPEYCRANFSKYFTESFWVDETLNSAFDGRHPCYFNTGVMIMDLDKWRQMCYSRIIELWMELQKGRRIYELGSLPPFLLVFAGRVKPVAHKWNQHGLGGDNFEGRCRTLHPGPVSLLHWSGKGKPWIRLDARRPCPLDSLWAPYDLFVPSHLVAK